MHFFDVCSLALMLHLFCRSFVTVICTSVVICRTGGLCANSIYMHPLTHSFIHPVSDDVGFVQGISRSVAVRTRTARQDEMNDGSSSADNDVGRRCKQSDGSRRRLNHYVNYTQPHPSILMRAAVAAAAVGRPVQPCLALSLHHSPPAAAALTSAPPIHSKRSHSASAPHVAYTIYVPYLQHRRENQQAQA